MAQQTFVKSLFQRLNGIGFDSSYIRSVALPEWWDESMTETEDGLAQTLILLSRNLHLDLNALWDENRPLECNTVGATPFKKSRNVTEDRLRQAQCIAVRAAQLACEAVGTPVNALPELAKEVRSSILEKGELVDFNALLDYCWQLGIPVLHVSEFPKKAHKMEGMAAEIKGRPVIVLSKNQKYSAWQVFILAHELGHIVSRHTSSDQMVFDESMDQSSKDEMEVAANNFAFELLLGRKARYRTNDSTPRSLAESATNQGRKDCVDPGVIVLNYAWVQNEWAVANAALKILEPNANAVGLVRTKMHNLLDWERLPADSQRFLAKVTGAAAKA